MKKEIVVVGSLNIDLVVHSPRHPEPGETIIGSDFKTFPGGKGANQAVAAARLGGKIAMVGKVGKDAFGSTLMNNLQKDGVDTSHVLTDPAQPTGVALITVADGGQNTIVVVSGANAALSPQDIIDAEDLFKSAGVLLVQLETPLETVEAAIDMAKKHEMSVVLNPAPARQLSRKLLSQVDYLVPNQSELALLSGVQDVNRGAGALRDLGIAHLVVTLGDEGVLVAGKAGTRRLPAYDVQVVDTTAAGDAFSGAFAVALTEDQATLQAARWGNAAGALAVTKAGAQPSLPTREEFTAFLKKHT